MALSKSPQRTHRSYGVCSVACVATAVVSVFACNDLLSIEKSAPEPAASAGQSGDAAGAPDSGHAAQGGTGSFEEAGTAGTAGGSAGTAGAAGSTSGAVIVGRTTRESVSSTGVEADSSSESASISSDGRNVAFASAARNLASDSWPYGTGVFLRDRSESSTISATKAIAWVKEGGGIQHPVLSSNGSVLVFATTASLKDDQNTVDTRLFKIQLRAEPPVAELIADTAYRHTHQPAINHDGKVVAYCQTRADTIHTDIYLVEGNGTQELISANASGSVAAGSSGPPRLNAAGDLVVFDSVANDLVSPDDNGVSDVFLRKRGSQPSTERISVALGGAEPNGPSSLPVISDNGQRIAFSSMASNLVANDKNDKEDIFVYDRSTKTTRLVSLASDGQTQGNGNSFYPALSANGRVIAFHSFASNLMPEAGPFIGDPNDTNVYVHDLETGRTVRASVPKKGAATGASMIPAISADGRFVAFTSYASNLVDDDTNHLQDIFVYEFTSAPWL